MKIKRTLKKLYCLLGIKYPAIQLVLIFVLTGTAIGVAKNTYVDVYSEFDCKVEVIAQKAVTVIKKPPVFDYSNPSIKWSDESGRRRTAVITSYRDNLLVLELQKFKFLGLGKSVNVFIKTGRDSIFNKVIGKMMLGGEK